MKKKNEDRTLSAATGGEKKKLFQGKNKENLPGTKKKHKKSRIIIAVILIFVVIIKIVSCATSSDSAAMVTTTSAVIGDLEETVSTSGKVVSEEKKVFFAPATGVKVQEVLAEAGDIVCPGDQLISFDMEQMEKRLREAALQQTKSNAQYQGALSDSSENQGKLGEATTNLDVLNKQIEDNKAYLKDLQSKLSKSQRDTSNSLSEESYNLNTRLSELQEELSKLGSVSDGDTNADRRREIEEEIRDVNSQIARNSYLQGIASSTDYVADMEEEIANVQERIADYEEYKARMESQKSGSEGQVMDSYDRQEYAADNELAKMSYEETEEEYYAAKKGIVAEFNGIVTECSAVEGATVTDGAQLLTLESIENVNVSFYASKYDIVKIEIGQKVDVTISDRTYQGEISKMNHMATSDESGTPMVGAQVHLLDPDENIILGLDAKLTIHTKETKNALLIPVEAVNADKSGDFLYVVENGIVVRKPIVCGISSDIYTEVVEGITEEDQIVLTSYGTIEEGMKVTAIPQ